METYLNQITAFLSNMSAYPIAAASFTMLVFAVLAKITDHATQQTLTSFCKKHDIDIEEKLFSIVHQPIWVVTLLAGAIVIFKWLQLLPQYQNAILGVFRTLILIVVSTTLNRFMKALFRYWIENRKSGTEIIVKIESAAQVVLLLISIALFLAIWKIDLGPVLTSAGVAGIVAAIAAKDALSNLIAGISLSLEAPFKVGDYIVLDTGERGKVTWIGLRSTHLLTRDDVQITIPNSLISSSKIINESAPFPRYRIRVKVGVAYGTDLDKAEDILKNIALDNPKVNTFPEPRVRVRELGDFALSLELLCWANQPETRAKLVHQLTKTTYERFQEESIIIPFPVQDIYIHSQHSETGHSLPNNE